MAEVLAAASLGLGGLNYASNAAAKKAANIQNATTNKWAPLLSLNHAGSGAPENKAKGANLGASLIPAITAASNALNTGKGTSDGADGGSAAGGSAPTLGADVSSLSSMPADTLAKYPWLAALQTPQVPNMASGGAIPGQQVVPGDSSRNDVKPIWASAGETMLPKTVSQAGMNGNMHKVAAYLGAVKKHGPGPMPVKSGPQNGKAPSSSMSPWAAMCSGGKVAY